jgi:hypothetical protein
MAKSSKNCHDCGGPLDTDDVVAPLQSLITEFQDAYPEASTAIRQCGAVIIGSDIGGCHPQSRHLVMTFVLVACDSSFGAWRAECKELRAKYIPDGRRISFKGLNDALKRRALPPFLHASDQLNGVLVSVIVDKGIGQLFLRGSRQDLDADVREGIASWKAAAIEQALRLSHVVAILMAHFGSADQSGIWIADSDEAFANPERIKTFCTLCDNVICGYSRPNGGSALFGTPETLPFGATSEDLLSVADLAAGTIAEWIPSALESGLLGDLPTSMLRVQFEKGKVNYLLAWYSGDSKPLKRLTIIVRPTTAGRFNVSSIRFIARTNEQSV